MTAFTFLITIPLVINCQLLSSSNVFHRYNLRAQLSINEPLLNKTIRIAPVIDFPCVRIITFCVYVNISYFHHIVHSVMIPTAQFSTNILRDKCPRWDVLSRQNTISL